MVLQAIMYIYYGKKSFQSFAALRAVRGPATLNIHMLICELLVESQAINLARKAYASLSPEAKSVIDAWESMNWIGGPLEQSVLAGDDIAQEIESAFEPVRAALPERVRLYRGYVPDAAWNSWQHKHLESWTSDRRVAEHFAGLRARQDSRNSLLYDVPTDDQIQQAVGQYERTGYVRFGNHHYVRSRENPQYYNIYDRRRQHVTDGDDLLSSLKSDQEWMQHSNDQRQGRSRLIERDIPREDIVWITNNLNSKEYIVRVQPQDQ